MRPRQRYRERRVAWTSIQTTTDPTTLPASSRVDTADSRRYPAVLAGGIALVASVGATGWAIGRHDPLAGHAGTSGPTTLTTAYNSACGLAGGNAVQPTVAPSVNWQDFGITSLPISGLYGPGRRSETASWSCFARTPSGAVLAAWTIPFRADVAKDFTTVVHQQTMAGPGQDALLKQGQTTHPLTDRVEPVGFRLVSYTPDAALVSFHVTQYGQHFRCGAQVQWSGGTTGDWLLQLQPDGNALSVCQRLTDAEAGDFVPWGPFSALR